MADRYPGYDVLAKRWTPSWNEQTRRVIDRRLAVVGPRFFTDPEYAAVEAIAALVVPRPKDRPPVPVAALIDDKLVLDRGDGYRPPDLPPQREAWRRGLRALDAEAAGTFATSPTVRQLALLTAMQDGALRNAAWAGMPCATFFHRRLLPDVVMAYYSHPLAWNEIGFGGPASPRGYVRLGYDERDPWEAAEADGR